MQIKNFATEIKNNFRSLEREAYAKRNYHGNNYVFDSRKAPDAVSIIKFFNKEFVFNKQNADLSFEALTKAANKEAEKVLQDSSCLKLAVSESGAGASKIQTFKKFSGGKRQANCLSQVKKETGILVDYQTVGGETKVKGIAYGHFSRDGKLASGFKIKNDGLITHAEFDSKGQPFNKVFQVSEEGNIYKANLPKGESNAKTVEVSMPDFYLKANLADGAFKKAQLYNQQQIQESGDFSNGFLHGKGNKKFPCATTIEGEWDQGVAKGGFLVNYPGDVSLRTKIVSSWLEADSLAEGEKRGNDTLNVSISYKDNASYEGSVALASDRMADWFKTSYKDDLLVMRDLRFVGEGIMHCGDYDFKIVWDDSSKPKSITLLNADKSSEQEMFLPYEYKTRDIYDPKTTGLLSLFNHHYLPAFKKHAKSYNDMNLSWANSVPDQKTQVDFYNQKSAEIKKAAREAVTEVMSAFSDPDYSVPSMGYGVLPAFDAEYGKLKVLVKSFKGFDRLVFSGTDHVNQKTGIISRIDIPKDSQKSGHRCMPLGQGISMLVFKDSADPEAFVKPPSMSGDERDFDIDAFLNSKNLRIFQGEIELLIENGGYMLQEGTLSFVNKAGKTVELWVNNQFIAVSPKTNIKIGTKKYKQEMMFSSLDGVKRKLTKCVEILPKGSDPEPKAFRHGEAFCDLRDFAGDFKYITTKFDQGVMVDQVRMHKNDGRIITIPLKKEAKPDFDNACIEFDDGRTYKGGVTVVDWPDGHTGASLGNWLELARASYDPIPFGYGEFAFLDGSYKLQCDWQIVGEKVAMQGPGTIHFGENESLDLNFDTGRCQGDATYTVQRANGSTLTAKLKLKDDVCVEIVESDFQGFGESDLKDLITNKLKSMPFIKTHSD